MAKHNKASKAQAIETQAAIADTVAIEGLPVAQASEGEAITEKPFYLGKYAVRVAKRGGSVDTVAALPLPPFKQASLALVIGTDTPKSNSANVHTELLTLFKALVAENETVTGNMLVNAMVNHSWLAGRNSAYIAARLAGRQAIADWCIGYLQGSLRRKYLVAK